MNKLTRFGLLLIIIIALGLRLYKISNPIADWHEFRQADTAAVTRNFVTNGIDLLRPRYDDLSNIQSGMDNPEGWRMVEFPIFNAFHYFVFKAGLLTGSINNASVLIPADEYTAGWLTISGRLTTLMSFLFALLFLYGIIFKLENEKIALIVAFFFSVMPYSIYYSRVILPDMMMIMCALGSIYFYLGWIRLDLKTYKPRFNIFYFLSLGFAAGALLIKPTSVFILIILAIISLKKWGLRLFKQYPVYVFIIMLGLPLIGWRLWISNFPEGVPAWKWLLNGDGIRLRPAWWRWIFYERLAKLILGGYGLVFLVLGLFRKVKISDSVYIFWGLAMFLYLVVFATGNVRHDYYQIIIIPLICVLLAKGVVYIWNQNHMNAVFKSIIILMIFSFMSYFSWYEVKGYYQINNPSIIKAGIHVNRILPKDAKVIAPYFGDTAFLYQTNRKGWPLVTNYPIEEMIGKGATHYVSVTKDEFTKELISKYYVLVENDDYVIIDLLKKEI